MKILKGDAGYIKKRKTQVTVKVLLEFAIVAALMILGITQTGTRMNLLTVVAILGCLPAGKALVELIMLLPHRTIASEKAEEIAEKTTLLTVAYDMIITSTEKAMPVDALVILDNTICGFASNPRTNPEKVGKQIKEMLASQRYDKVVVKIFSDYTAFITRAEGMQNMASVSRPETHKKEEAMRQFILQISL